MNIFFDTEFTGLHKNTTLISIGCISDNNSFYAELTDFDNSQVDDWIKENVINNLLYYNNKTGHTDDINKSDFTMYGDSYLVAEYFKKWLSQFDSVQFISDVCYFDFILLINLFGTAFDLPKNVSPVCRDINQDIAKHFNITDKEAFDIDRIEFVKQYDFFDKFNDIKKHNSLFDAKIIRYIYELIY